MPMFKGLPPKEKHKGTGKAAQLVYTAAPSGNMERILLV